MKNIIKEAYNYINLKEKLVISNFNDILSHIDNDPELKKFMVSKIKDLPDNIKYSVGDNIHKKYLDKTPIDYLKDVFNYNRLGDKFQLLISEEDEKYLGWVSYSVDLSTGSLVNIKFGSFYVEDNRYHTLMRMRMLKDLKEFFDGMLSNKVDILFVANKNNPFIKHYYSYLKKYGGDTLEVEGDNVIFQLSTRKKETCKEANEYLNSKLRELRTNLSKGNNMGKFDKKVIHSYDLKKSLERFDMNGKGSKNGYWRIEGDGWKNSDFDVYYDGKLVIQCRDKKVKAVDNYIYGDATVDFICSIYTDCTPIYSYGEKPLKYVESKGSKATIQAFSNIDVKPVSVSYIGNGEVWYNFDDKDTAHGYVYFEIVLKYAPTGEVWKERWEAECSGWNNTSYGVSEPDVSDAVWTTLEDDVHFDEYTTPVSDRADEYYQSSDTDIIYGVCSMIQDCLDNDLETINYEDNMSENKKWSEDNWLLKVKESKANESKLNEANRIYKYTIRLTQPEGGRYRLTNQKDLKFKTKEEAEATMNRMLKANGERMASKGLGLEVVEIPSKPRKKIGSLTDNPDYKNPFEVGDILEGDEGYSMTLPNFIKITKVTPTRVYGRYLKTKVSDTDSYGQSGYKVPTDQFESGRYKSGEMVLTVKRYHNTGNDKTDYYAWLSTSGGHGYTYRLWDGKPAFYDTMD